MILPYTFIDGLPTLRDSELETLYLTMLEEDKLQRVFYDGGIRSPEDFIRYFKSGGGWLYTFIDEDRNFYGFFWVNCFEGETCRVHFCMFNRAGKNILRLGREGIEFLKQYFRLIRGVTPADNSIACKFIEKVGMIPLGVMPNRIYNWWEERYEPALLSYCIGKED